MKYHVLIDGGDGDGRDRDRRHHEIQVEPHAGGFRVVHGGHGSDHAHQIDVATVADGEAYSLLIDGRSIDVGVEERGERVDVLVSGRRYPAEVLGEREWLARSIERSSGEGDRRVRAVMSGIVREVLVAQGDAVVAGQVVLILEAMKMENEVKAEAAGTVQALHVAAGQTVEQGVVLMELG